jgi:hypothetical protein
MRSVQSRCQLIQLSAHFSQRNPSLTEPWDSLFRRGLQDQAEVSRAGHLRLERLQMFAPGPESGMCDGSVMT